MHKKVKAELRIFSIVQIILICLILCSGLGLLIGQWILADESLRSELRLQDWYGSQYAVEAAQTDIRLWGNIVLEMEKYTTLPHMAVYINGEKAGSFDTARLVLKVYPGDLVEIDSSAYSSPVTVRLVGCSSGIDTSDLNMHMQLKRERRELGIIVFK